MGNFALFDLLGGFMGYFKQINSEKVILIETIQAAQVLLNSYMNSREKCLSKWDNAQFRLDDLQQELCDIEQAIGSING